MKKRIKIGNKYVSKDGPVFIIAEAGVNHNGQLDLALQLIDAALEAGADAVKFQTFKAEQVVTGNGKMAEYQKKNIGKIGPQVEMLKKLEFNESWYPKIINYCRKKGIIFLSTPHGHIESADFLNKLGVAAFKIGSGDLTNKPLLEHIARFGKPMILGTGMATLEEVKNATGWIKEAGNNKVVFLHCTTNYPCPWEMVNLKAMQTMAKEIPDILVGYSDHTEGGIVSTMAVTLGACVIEKHITLDKNMCGPDHKASSDPIEFKTTVNALRNVSIIMGSAKKLPTQSEKKIISISRKSIVSLVNIKIGEKFTSKNIGIKRPGNGLAPKYYFKLIGGFAKKNIKADTLIKRNDYKKY